MDDAIFKQLLSCLQATEDGESIYVGATFILQADVAVDKYGDGAVYDEENDLRLLNSCFLEENFNN